MKQAEKSFLAHGKLLLTAEYFVLDGALALALPAKLGQSLDLRFTNDDLRLGEPSLRWQSFDEKKQCWFEGEFELENFEILKNSDSAVATRLQKILREARNLNPAFLHAANSQPQSGKQLTANSHLSFPRLWGLGTSSTLIHLVAQWAEVDAFELQFRTFGGSGYDIACAGAEGPILYFLKNGKPHVEPCDFHPPFANQLYFIYLGQKQDSREGIARYRSAVDSRQLAVEEISALTRGFLVVTALADFEKLIVEHENLVSKTVGLPRAKDLYFSDFWGEIKSLGAWGGDFILATSDRPEEETLRYFNEKGYEVFLPYESLIL